MRRVSGCGGVAGWREDAGDPGDGFAAGAGVAHGRAGVAVAGLGHDELERDLLLAEVGGGGVAELVGVQADLLIHADADAVVAEAGPSGVGADVLGTWAACGDGFAVGEEERSAGTDRAVEVAVGKAARAAVSYSIR